MAPIIKYITDFGGSIITSIGDTLDKFITTKEEKSKALAEISQQVNSRIEHLREMAVKDTMDARSREVQTVNGEHVPLLNKIIVPILALIVLIGGGFMYYNSPQDRTTIGPIIMLVLAYYFGSSLGSRRKQDFIESRQGK